MLKRFTPTGPGFANPALTLTLAVLAGCGGPNIQSETFRSSGIAEGAAAPSWVEGTPRLWAAKAEQVNGQMMPRVANAEQRVFFVGRAVGHNVLDERNAHQLAVDNAIRQAARQVMTRTREYRRRARKDSGVEFFPKAKYKAATAQHVLAKTDALTRAMQEHDVYWERWEVRHGESPGSGAGLTRWKCWVLMSVSQQQLEDLADQTRRLRVRESPGQPTLFRVSDQ
jgi:hypothetical protein